MKLEFIKNQKKWDALILKQEGNFMQSWRWGEFRKKNDIPVLRMKLKTKGSQIVFQLEKRKLPLKKSYFYVGGINYNPLIIEKKTGEFFLKEIRKIANKEKVIFLKWESIIENQTKSNKLTKMGFVPSKNIQPKDTLILDINKPKEKLLKDFHSKTRYNIRLAERKGVKVKEAKGNKELKSFWKLIELTNAKKSIQSFDFSYYKNLFNLSDNSGNLKVKFLLASLKNTPIAGSILIVWKDEAVYLAGCSDYSYRKVMAPHLLQWEAIKTAQDLRCKNYNFWGIIKQEDFQDNSAFKNHPWYGISRFKKGFGGKMVNYDPAYDYIFSPFWYRIYQIAKKLKN